MGGREGGREGGRKGKKSIPDVDEFGTGEELAEDADAGRVGGGLGREGGRLGRREGGPARCEALDEEER